MINYSQYTLAIGGIGHWELIIILLVALLIFGRRLPEIARGMGKSLSEFKKGVREAEETKDEFVKDVKKIGDEVEKEAKGASGLNDNLKI